MIDHLQYAVYLHPGALESLGDVVTPYLTQDATGAHFVCVDIDTGGALCELTVERDDSDRDDQARAVDRRARRRVRLPQRGRRPVRRAVDLVSVRAPAQSAAAKCAIWSAYAFANAVRAVARAT